MTPVLTMVMFYFCCHASGWHVSVNGGLNRLKPVGAAEAGFCRFLPTSMAIFYARSILFIQNQ